MSKWPYNKNVTFLKIIAFQFYKILILIQKIIILQWFYKWKLKINRKLCGDDFTEGTIPESIGKLTNLKEL